MVNKESGGISVRASLGALVEPATARTRSDDVGIVAGVPRRLVDGCAKGGVDASVFTRQMSDERVAVTLVQLGSCIGCGEPGNGHALFCATTCGRRIANAREWMAWEVFKPEGYSSARQGPPSWIRIRQLADSTIRPTNGIWEG